MFGFDAQISGNVKNHLNKFEQKNAWCSRCLGDKMGFNDTNQIFTSDATVVLFFSCASEIFTKEMGTKSSIATIK